MAKPNYGYEKRQREIAKKKKKEEKRLRKAGADQSTPEDAQSPSTADDNSTPGTD
jgi:hypothetical protein